MVGCGVIRTGVSLEAVFSRMAFHLKLLQPKELPADGLTSAEFKPWQNHVINFLQQDVENFRFLPGGKYAAWHAANENVNQRRISQLVDDDEDKLALVADATLTEAARNAQLVKLLDSRNSQLGKMLQHIMSFAHYTEADDIDQSSTSMEWIFNYLRAHYNLPRSLPAEVTVVPAPSSGVGVTLLMCMTL